MRVLHVLGSAALPARAIPDAVAAWDLALGPDARAAAVFVEGTGPLVPALEAAGVRASAGEGGAAVGAVVRAARDFQADILHQHYGGRALRLSVRARTRLPVVSHIHGLTDDDGVRLRAGTFTVGASAVAAVSRAAAAVGGTGTAVIPPPVTMPDEPVSRPASTPLVGMAGRLVAVKGVEFLLEAFASLVGGGAEANLEIAGDGSLRESLERRSQELGLSDRVRFLGWVDDLDTVMRRWQIYVQPSVSEGASMTALQAMALGLPVLATSAGGLPETLGDAGLLVEAGDPRPLAEAIRRLQGSAELRQRLGQAARRRVTELNDPARSAGLLRVVYESVLR